MKTKIFFLAALLMAASGAFAQHPDVLYAEGKAFYDAKEYKQAVPKLKAAAEKGHKKAQYRLGRCYDKGYGVREDDKLAFGWYAKSAAQGYAKAEYQLGKCYKNGEGTTKDRSKAVEYFRKAAAQGNADGQLALGKCYLKGKGVPEDLAKAVALFKKAVSNEKDGKEIMGELRSDAAQGDADAKDILRLLKDAK